MHEKAPPRGTNSLLVMRDSGEPIAREAVRWAVDALQDAYDSPSIRALAGLDLDGFPNSFEADALVRAALRELGLAEGDRAANARRYLRDLCAAMIAGQMSPSEAIELIHRRVVTPLQHPADLRAWCFLWEGNSADCSRALEGTERDEAILDYAAQFLGEGDGAPR
jgi:hypothetical protein